MNITMFWTRIFSQNASTTTRVSLQSEEKRKTPNESVS